jgi:hypothetical protein
MAEAKNKTAEVTPEEITGVATAPDKTDDDLTVAEYIDKYSLSGGKLRTKNYTTLAKDLKMEVSEVIQICKDLGHRLPEGA